MSFLYLLFRPNENKIDLASLEMLSLLDLLLLILSIGTVIGLTT